MIEDQDKAERGQEDADEEGEGMEYEFDQEAEQV